MDYKSQAGTGSRQSGSPARLASFRPPRDLSLLGVSSDKLKNLVNPPVVNKRVFTPNVNVARRKASACPTAPSVPKEGDPKPRHDKNRKPKSKGNFIQTQGIFSEGLSTEKIKSYSRNAEPTTAQIVKPKLDLTRNVSSKKKNDSLLSRRMKDDFIDDPGVVPNLYDPPISLPLFAAKSPISVNVESTFESFQVKMEKNERNFDPHNVFKLFEEPSTSKLLVFQFPPEFETKEVKKSGKEVKQEEVTKPSSLPTNRVANLAEGRFGTLKVLQNGKMFFEVGDEKIPLEVTRNCLKQNVMAVELAETESRAAVVNLGRVSANFVCSSDLSYPNYSIHEWKQI